MEIGLPCEEKSEEKSGEKNRGGDITSMHLRRSLFFVAPATPAATPSRRQPGETVQALSGRPGCALPGAPKLPSLHLSPRGEAKCERGPSGRGASRLARAGVLDRTSSTASKRNEVMAVVSRASRQGGERCRLGCRARGAFVLSKTAAQDARPLRADELRPRRRDGASWSQIRCLQGRSVRRCCERDAQPKTAARTAAPAVQSLLPCSLLPGIARGGGGP